jgi:hypothetical protein
MKQIFLNILFRLFFLFRAFKYIFKGHHKKNKLIAFKKFHKFYTDFVLKYIL